MFPTDESRSPTIPNLDVILKFSDCDATIGSATLQAACGDQSGVPRHFFSFSASNKTGTQAKGDPSLPSNDARIFFTNDVSGSLKEGRAPWYHLTGFTGTSLSAARDPSEWMRAIASAVIGYYVMMLNGYHHHDINIGNVLLSHEATKADKPIMETLRQLRISKEQLDKLEILTDGLRLTDGCMGFVIDADLAIKFRDEYFGMARQGMHLGTNEFMSIDLIRSATEGYEYLQSPVDDFYSFFFTAQWSAAFNVKNEQAPKKLLVFQQEICSNHQERSASTMTVLSIVPMDVLDYGKFLVTCQPFLRSWYSRIDMLAAEWYVYMRSNPSNEALPDAFRDFAFKGVVATLECAMEFMSRLEDKADGGR